MTTNIAASIQAAAARGAVACDKCDADYRAAGDPEYPSITHLTIIHDDWCPFYQRRTNRAGRRATR
jgi:hypothetical protein